MACLQGNRFWVAARHVILATGGIENARLLLLSNKKQTAGLGNQNDLVGRFFMDHPGLKEGVILLSDPNISTTLYRRDRDNPGLVAKIDGGTMEKFLTGRVDKKRVLGWIQEGAEEQKYLDVVKPIIEGNCVPCHSPGGIAFFRPLTSYQEVMAVVSADLGRNGKTDRRFKGALTLSPEVQRMEKLLNYRALLDQTDWTSALHGDSFWDSLENVITNIGDISEASYHKLFKSSSKRKLFKLVNCIEPTPNPESRVTLTKDRDMLGQNRVRLDWRLSEIDKRTFIRSQEIIGLELGRAGIGRLMVAFDKDNSVWPETLRHGWHHMGTTRMHIDPKQGVVDANCKVHGISNLFIAGSSVFPTYGYANPTLTIVALAIRLADNIKRIMS